MCAYFYGIDDLSKEVNGLSDVCLYLVQFLLLPQIERLPHLPLARKALLVWYVRCIYNCQRMWVDVTIVEVTILAIEAPALQHYDSILHYVSNNGHHV